MSKFPNGCPAITPVCPNLKCKSKSGMEHYDNNGKQFYLCSDCSTVVPIKSGIKAKGRKLSFEQYNKLYAFNRSAVRNKRLKDA